MVPVVSQDRKHRMQCALARRRTSARSCRGSCRPRTAVQRSLVGAEAARSRRNGRHGLGYRQATRFAPPGHRQACSGCKSACGSQGNCKNQTGRKGPDIGTGEQGNPGAHVQVHSCCLCHCACGIGRGIHLHFAGLVVAKCFCGARAACVIELSSSCCPAQIGVRVALRCVIVCVDTE